MNWNPYRGQIEQQVLSADPIELMALVFDHLIATIADARRHLVDKNRAARARSMSRAFGLIGELAHSLDSRQGGEVARNLRRIYGYVGSRLAEAQSYETEQPLIDAIRALEPLREAWKDLCRIRTEELASSQPPGGCGGSARLALQA